VSKLESDVVEICELLWSFSCAFNNAL